MSKTRRRTDDEDDDAFENGILKDGRSWRVPLYLCDSMQREMHAWSQSMQDTRPTGDRTPSVFTDGHKPGFARPVADAAARQAVEDAYKWRLDEDTNAWRRGSSDITATNSSTGLFASAQEGDRCTVRDGGVNEGAPGRLKMIGGVLTCVPGDWRSTDAAPVMPTGPIVDAKAAAAAREQAYTDAARADAQAWMKGKTPQTNAMPRAPIADAKAARAAVEAAYAAYDEEQQNAWRGPRSNGKW
jgi:hypothetical protein